MIRVLHVIDHLDLGGAQTALLDMLRHRDQSRFKMEVAVMHGLGTFAQPLAEAGVRVRSLAGAKWPPSYIPNFLRLIRKERYPIVHFHLQGANWLAKPLAALATNGLRIAHDHTSGDLRFRGLVSLLPDSASHHFSTRIIAVSPGVRDFLVRWEAVARDRIDVVPNGVDDGDFRPATAGERAAERERLGLPPDRLVAGAIGRLAPEKNLAMVPELAARHPEILFLIAGAGPEETAIAARARKLGVADRVRLLGAISDRSGFFRTLDIFLLPSLYEGLPMALLEAMASGVPVLSSHLADIAIVVQDGQNGLLAPPGSVAAFSEGLARLAASEELRRRLARHARKKVVDAYSAAHTAQQIEEIYDRELAIANLRSDARRLAQ